MINETPRVRFAPSPTGYLHVGGLRTALYNYLFAKINNGKFILRIEDTDRNRFVEGAVENLIDTLNWVGLEFDEGPKTGGDFGPYLQSERLDIYKNYANQLITDGKAYHCFCSQERLQNLREEQQKQKLPQMKYDKHCLNLSKEEIRQKLDAGENYVVRLNVQPGIKVIISDIVRGRVEFDRDTIDDQVLIKSDGYPTYHLANVVDDHLMKITHVIRGEEWLSSTPKHILLYQYLNWELPEFAHLPLLLNPDRSKLSKRQGDVAVEDYQSKGYLKEALINFVALLGWSTGDNKEFYTIEELKTNFSIERVHKSGAIFNIDKLNWLNSEHIKNKTAEEILPELKNELSNSKFNEMRFSDDYLKQVIDSMKERVIFYNEFLTKSPYFFERPQQYDEEVLKKRWKEDTPDHMKNLAENFEKMEESSHDNFEAALRKTAEELEIGAGKLIHPVRLAVSGIGVGPGVFDLLAIIGKDEVIERINIAINKITIPSGN
ncbi:MAG: glutamate--tRNA ligase [Melioribacteraceae bacterium]|nr:glutamate--tRNA ligase [Melioribacteraceae bacterium]MCF8353941.1 glutamate--tRNA ligase [Melioribacteraceae bacterium]MCF8393669.1 glutamate--tRNA ligase [Melioribacteraceae bacterium]MCF8419589.1 glutamate--tRNA ligase [Melioribacteraceae bacterium]